MGHLNDLVHCVDKQYALLCLIFLAPATLIGYVIIKALVSPLRRLPGPFLARFSRIWYLRNVWRGDFEKKNLELHQKYGTNTIILSLDITY